MFRLRRPPPPPPRAIWPVTEVTEPVVVADDSELTTRPASELASARDSDDCVPFATGPEPLSSVVVEPVECTPRAGSGPPLMPRAGSPRPQPMFMRRHGSIASAVRLPSGVALLRGRRRSLSHAVAASRWESRSLTGGTAAALSLRSGSGDGRCTPGRGLDHRVREHRGLAGDSLAVRLHFI